MRLSAADAHYGGNLVDGAHGLEIFGDIVTELAVRTDGDEGLFAGYEKVEFLAPMLRAATSSARTGTIVRMGNTSRTVDLEIWKEISARPEVSDSAADLLDPTRCSSPARAARTSSTASISAARGGGSAGAVTGELLLSAPLITVRPLHAWCAEVDGGEADQPGGRDPADLAPRGPRSKCS